MPVTPISMIAQLNIAREQLAEVNGLENRCVQLVLCGRFARIVGETAKAESDLLEALGLAKQLFDVSLAVKAYIELAYCNRLLGRYAEVFEHLRSAHKLVRNSHYADNEALFWVSYIAGIALGDRALRRRAALCLEYAERKAAAIERSDLRALALARLIDAGTLEDEQQDKAREDTIKLAESCEQVEALCLALLHSPRSDGTQELQRAYDLARATESAELIIETGNKLAFGLRDNQKALQGLELERNVAEIATRLSYRRLEALCQHNLGVMYKGLGRFQEARAPLEKAVVIQREINSRRLTSSLAELSLAYLGTGQYDLGIRSVTEAYNIHERRGNLRGMQLQARNIGIFYHRLNDWSAAVEWYEKSRALIVQRTGGKNQTYLTGSLASLHQAWARKSIGDERAVLLAKALNYADQAIDRTEGMLFPKEEGKKPKTTRIVRQSYTVNLGRKGSILLDLDRPDEAWPYLYRSYRFAKKWQFVRRLPRRLSALALAYFRRGRVHRALQVATVAVIRARILGSSFSVELISAYLNRAKLLVKMNQPVPALSDYEEAIKLVQESFSLLQSENTSMQALVDWEEVFGAAAKLAWSLGDTIKAFDLQEIGRAPVFRKLIASTNLRPPDIISRDLLDQEQILLDQKAALQEKISTASDDDGDDDVENLRQQLDVVQRALDEIWEHMASHRTASEYVMIRRSKSMSYIDIHKTLTTQLIT
jgi:tetratricopeptide (TPR) repeat protein